MPHQADEHLAKVVEEPKVNIVNIDADTHPCISRGHLPGEAVTTDVLLRLATMLKEEDALIVNLTVTHSSIEFVGALKDDWDPRITRAIHGPTHDEYDSLQFVLQGKRNSKVIFEGDDQQESDKDRSNVSLY